MELQVHLQGLTGLVMHNARLADPLDPVTIELAAMTSKTKKTEDDHRAIADLEWRGSLYFDPTIGPYVLAEAIQRSLVNAAGTWRLGPKTWDYVTILDPRIALQYDGPRSLDKLAQREENRFRKTIVVNRGSRTIRTRPIFRAWALDFPLTLESDGLTLADFRRIIERAGRYHGLGDGRKLGYGRFNAEVIVQ